MANRNVYFNAPAIKFADIGKYAGRYADGNSDELISKSPANLIPRKGWLSPDVSYLSDWNSTTGPEEEDVPEDADSEAELSEAAKRPFNAETLMPQAQYGFRFMYNPPTISFNLGLATGLNPSYIFSGQEKAMMLIGSGSSIGVELTINRTEDIAVLNSADESELVRILNSQAPANYYPKWVNPGILSSEVTPGSNSRSVSLSFPRTSVTVEQLREIREHGTMHDMNYLFRTFTARNWKTAYRQETADVGIAYGVPQVLYLSQKMVYRVRMSGINYQHKIFNENMIPTLTDVSLTFERIPDVIDWAGDPIVDANPGS